MSTKPKAPKKKKVAKPRPPKISETDLFRGDLPLDLIMDAPDLLSVPTLLQASEMDTDGDGPRGQWLRLHDSVGRNGIDEPLKCVRSEGSAWLCFDGRSRRASAALHLADGKQRFASVPVMEITKEQAERIVLDSLHRRMVPDYVIAYLACLKHEGQLTARKRGRPSKAINMDDAITQEALSIDLDIPQSTISSCVAALRHFQEHPADREKDEPKILAGLMDPVRVIHASEGRQHTAGKDRRPTSYKSWLPKLKSFSSNLRGFDKWGADSHANTAAILALEVRTWPESFRDILSKVINEGGPEA